MSKPIVLILPVFDNPIPSRVQITDKFTKFDGRIGGKMHYNMAFDTKRKKHTYALLYLVATNLKT